MSSRLFTLGVALGAVVLLAQTIQQTPPKPPPPESNKQQSDDEPKLRRAPAFASISGVITSASTGSPVPGAEISALEKDGKDFRTAKSDANGQFKIEGLVPGSYVVSCALSGYVTTKFPQQSSPGQSWRVPPFYLVLAPSQQTSAIDFRMEQNASISGVVSTQDGRGIAGVSVQAFSQYYTHEGARLAARGAGRTDGQGRYRISALAPGTYFVHAEKIVGPEGFAPSFYPAAAEASAAKSIQLHIGQDLTGIDLKLTKTPGYRVAGKLRDLRNDTDVTAGFTVTAAPELGSSGVRATIAKDGTFQFDSLIPGKYRLTVSMTDLLTGALFKASQSIEVKPEAKPEDLSNIVVPIGVGHTVRVTVKTTEGLLPARLPLMLVNREDAEEPGRAVAPLRAAMLDLDTYQFYNVPAGDYLLLLGASTLPDTRSFYFQSVTLDEKDAWEPGFIVPAGIGKMELTATVNRHGGILNGIAKDGADLPLQGRPIVVVSADREQRRRRNGAMVAWTDSFGVFHLFGLTPGPYFAVLWTGGDPVEALNPTYWDEMERNAARITISTDTQTSITLKSGRSSNSPPSHASVP